MEKKEFLGEQFIEGGRVRDCRCSIKIGVYLIVYTGAEMPNLIYPSPAGRQINRMPADPTVLEEKLKEKWVENVSIVYIGKTERGLQKRMKEHIDFWGGKDMNRAWGGRIIAQIKGYKNLEVWYMECDDPMQKEAELIDRFKSHYGKLPFANWKGGNK